MSQCHSAKGEAVAEYDVVLLPTFAQVENWRKRQAAETEAGLCSQTVTTFNAWIAVRILSLTRTSMPMVGSSRKRIFGL